MNGRSADLLNENEMYRIRITGVRFLRCDLAFVSAGLDKFQYKIEYSKYVQG